MGVERARDIAAEIGIAPGRGVRVVVAMSGGVDSSVAAALLAAAGHEVVGCFMRLGSPGDEVGDDPCDGPSVRIGHQGCCSIGDAADARLVAARLGVPFRVLNFREHFERIIDYFVAEYTAGRTPNPCVRCNDWLKFGELHRHAERIGAAFVASGHYARIGRDHDGRATLLRGLDRDKDQSYVLFGARRERLERMLLPIGSLPKARVRAIAAELGLPVFDKPDSQEICFVPDNNYARLVEQRSPAAAADAAGGGEIIGHHGDPLGHHPGQHRFTIGQRRGHGVATGTPLYVVERDAPRNRIRLGPREALLTASVVATDVNWLTDPPPEGTWFQAAAAHRANAPPEPARARWLDGEAGGILEVAWDQPTWAAAPGQAVVLYDRPDGDRVLGGGWIGRVARHADQP